MKDLTADTVGAAQYTFYVTTSETWTVNANSKKDALALIRGQAAGDIESIDLAEVDLNVGHSVEFQGQSSIRGEIVRSWQVDDRWMVEGFHTPGSTSSWGVCVTARTPDGASQCGQSFRIIAHVPGGHGRDDRVLAAGLAFLKAEPDYHGTATCAVCKMYPAPAAVPTQVGGE